MIPIIKKHEVVLGHSFKTWPYAFDCLSYSARSFAAAQRQHTETRRTDLQHSPKPIAGSSHLQGQQSTPRNETQFYQWNSPGPSGQEIVRPRPCLRHA